MAIPTIPPELRQPEKVSASDYCLVPKKVRMNVVEKKVREYHLD
jgi:hypothetical protein